MHVMHPTLLVGPADWDAARMPRQEFDARIAAFWRAVDPAIAGAIVFGSPRRHAELAYLTHFTPKLEAAIALVPRNGPPRLLVGGGANMLGAAKPLTWVEALLPLRDTGAAVARWRDELGTASLALVNGDAMPFGMRQGIETALGAPLADATDTVTDAMRRKSVRELDLMREACATLAASLAAMRDAQRAGQGMTNTVLAAERVARERGAQDVRSLFGRDGGLQPFTLPDNAEADPLQVYLTVRHGGYWAEGFAALSRSRVPTADAASAVLRKALGLVRPGIARRDLARVLAQETSTRAHSVTQGNFGNGIGLALDGPGCLNDDGKLMAGEVYTVRVGLRAEDGAAIVSAMVAVTEKGHEVLWPGDDR
jgi:Xaa-Pro aminopeptidase